MIKLESLETCIQLAAGVNLAYSSFVELRQPALSRELEAIERANSAIKIRNKEISSDKELEILNNVSANLLQLRIQINTYKNRLDKFDHSIQVISILLFALCVFFLIYASLTTDFSLSFGVALFICLVGYIPQSVSLLTNALVDTLGLRSMRHRRRALLDELVVAG